jgi:hypothetical protein
LTRAQVRIDFACSKWQLSMTGPGKEPTITAEAKAWLVSLACRKATELGYPHELWTTRLLARHAREHGPAEGHACLDKVAQGTACKILNHPRRKWSRTRSATTWNAAILNLEVLCVYREVKIIKETAAAAKQEPGDAVAIISYDHQFSHTIFDISTFSSAM